MPLVITSLAVSAEISLPFATARTVMSRSVTMPTSRSFSPMGMAPISCYSIAFANVFTGVSGGIHSTPLCMELFTFMAYSSGALTSQDKRNHGQASCAEVPFANLDFSAADAGKSCAPVRSISCSPSKPARSDDKRGGDCVAVGMAIGTSAVLSAMTGTECGAPHYCTWTANQNHSR